MITLFNIPNYTIKTEEFSHYLHGDIVKARTRLNFLIVPARRIQTRVFRGVWTQRASTRFPMFYQYWYERCLFAHDKTQSKNKLRAMHIIVC